MRVLARESPAHLSAVANELGALTVSIRVDDTPAFGMSFAGGPPWVRVIAAADVEVAMTTREVDDLLAGAVTVDEAVLADRLAVRGDATHVLRFLDALRHWLHGALRSPSMPRLRDTVLAETTT